MNLIWNCICEHEGFNMPMGYYYLLLWIINMFEYEWVQNYYQMNEKFILKGFSICVQNATKFDPNYYLSLTEFTLKLLIG